MIDVVCAVIFRDDSYTISRRLDGSHQGGKWEFPGGKREDGETLEEALVRECQEELGILIEAPQEIDQFDFSYGDLSLRFTVYWVEDYTGEAQGLEGQVVDTVTLEELKTRDFPEANFRIFDVIDQFLMDRA